MLDLSEEYLCLGLKKSFYKLDTYAHGSYTLHKQKI